MGTGVHNATGHFNTALGTNASSMKSGSNNIAIGNKALSGVTSEDIYMVIIILGLDLRVAIIGCLKIP